MEWSDLLPTKCNTRAHFDFAGNVSHVS